MVVLRSTKAALEQHGGCDPIAEKMKLASDLRRPESKESSGMKVERYQKKLNGCLDSCKRIRARARIRRHKIDSKHS